MAYTPEILIEADDYDEVRLLLGGISSTVLPDATIETYVFLGEAEMKVKNAANAWLADGFNVIATEAGNDWEYLRMATKYLVAAGLATNYVSQVAGGTGFKAGGYSETGIGGGISWSDRANQLMDKVWYWLAKISRREFTAPTSFIATGPTSSGEAVPEYEEEWHEMVQPRIIDWAEEGGEDDDYYSTSR